MSCRRKISRRRFVQKISSRRFVQSLCSLHAVACRKLHGHESCYHCLSRFSEQRRRNRARSYVVLYGGFKCSQRGVNVGFHALSVMVKVPGYVAWVYRVCIDLASS